MKFGEGKKNCIAVVLKKISKKNKNTKVTDEEKKTKGPDSNNVISKGKKPQEQERKITDILNQ